MWACDGNSSGNYMRLHYYFVSKTISKLHSPQIFLSFSLFLSPFGSPHKLNSCLSFKFSQFLFLRRCSVSTPFRLSVYHCPTLFRTFGALHCKCNLVWCDSCAHAYLHYILWLQFNRQFLFSFFFSYCLWHRCAPLHARIEEKTTLFGRFLSFSFAIQLTSSQVCNNRLD